MILQNPYFRKGTFEDDGDIEVITLDEYDNFLQQVTIYPILLYKVVYFFVCSEGSR